MTDFRALCAEIVQLENEQQPDYADWKRRWNAVISRARAALAQPAPETLPPGYIDPEHSGADRKLLEVFYAACNSEGGTADEIHLRGIRAVLAAQPAPPAEGKCRN
jgi:hypothetical protein